VTDEIWNFCCDEHNKALVAAREKARQDGHAPQSTPEEVAAQDAIEKHLAERRDAQRVS
jgi:hypothetical protein